MNNHTILFSVTNTYKIIITLEEPLAFVGWGYEENIILLHNNKKLILADGPIHYNMQQLSDLLTKAISNDLPLHKSITSDIGYLLNEYHKDKKGFAIKEFSNGLSAWVGYEYFLWQAQNNNISYSTWLYNDDQNNITLKVTSLYPYFYCDVSKEINYITYQNWIKTYHPYLTIHLPREIAIKWLNQANSILKTIQSNVNEWEKEDKNE